MRPIKKKYVFATKVDFKIDDLYRKALSENSDLKNRKIKDMKEIKYGVLQSNDGQLVQSFVHHIEEKVIILPEPNPIVIFFSNAQSLYEIVLARREEIIRNFNYNDILYFDNVFYEFFCNASVYLTFLFISIEAFTNSLIPDDYNYKKELKGKTEIYNKQQIQLSLSFEEKIKVIIPEITGKSFHQIHSHKHDLILKLKSLRDNIIHTKTYKENFPQCYRKLYVECLDFDHKKIIYNVKDFINYYEPDLIEIRN